MSAPPDVPRGDLQGAGAIEHRHLRSALEYAVLVAEETQRRKPAMAVPNELRAFFGKPRIPAGALGRLRRAIEADDVFRRRIAAGASPELVDEVGRLWLNRPDNWEADACAAIAAEDAARSSADVAVALRREQKRRAAAEESAVRSRADAIRLEALVEEQRGELDRLVADLEKAGEALSELRAELVDVRNEARHARDREAAAARKLAAVIEEQRRRGGPAAPADPAADTDPRITAAEFAALRKTIDQELHSLREAAERSAAEAAEAARRVEGLLTGAARRLDGTDSRPGIAERRRPLRLPGGVLASSAEAAAFLVRSNAVVFIDGYNVSMLGWPNLAIDEQRVALVNGVENLARRFGTDATVVFDGARVVGAHATRRRAIRVAYSPPGVIADDVIREEVARVSPDRAVVVVTNDAAVAHDARALGANVVPSNAFLAVL